MRMLLKDKNGRLLRSIKITKAVKLNMGAQRLYIEPMNEGGCRLAFSSAIIEDWQRVRTIEMDRDTCPNPTEK